MNDFSKLGMFRASGLGVLFSVALGCAGTDVPPTTDEIEEDLRTAYGRGATPAAGGSSSTGNGGSANAAAGSAGSGDNGGASNAGEAGEGGADNSGGSTSTEAGSGGEGEGGTGEAGAGGSGSEGCDGFQLLATACSGSSCHNGGGLTPFAAEEGDAADFIGTKSPSYPGCGDIFDPGDPAGSVVIQKMRGDSACGPQMPLGAAPLSEADITCVEEWIGTL